MACSQNERAMPVKICLKVRGGLLLASLFGVPLSLSGCSSGIPGDDGFLGTTPSPPTPSPTTDDVFVGTPTPDPTPAFTLATPFPTPRATLRPTPFPTQSPTLAPMPGAAEPQVWEHFILLNRLRRSGVHCPDGTYYPPNKVELKFDCRLWRAADLHSQHMADMNYFGHTSLDGRGPGERSSAQGFSCRGENLAAGSSSAQHVLNQWKLSDGHCKNMMDPDSKTFAVGYGYNGNSDYVHHWTQMFGGDTLALDTSCYPAATCAANPKCAHLEGHCCPQLDGTMLACCEAPSAPALPFLSASIVIGDAWRNNFANVNATAPVR